MSAVMIKEMIRVDGSKGEGGGQIFRTALTLSMLMSAPVTIENIRSGRAKSGMLRQHLTCLRAAQEICGANVSGGYLGSGTVIFEPGKVLAGNYKFSVGSAGSALLVLQTVLLPLMFTDETTTLSIEGGTHNGMAPSADYINECYKPALERMGYKFDIKLIQYGFYPAGGGALDITVYSVRQLKRFSLMSAGELKKASVTVTSARLPSHVAERELNSVKSLLAWDDLILNQRPVRSAGPGNIISIRLEMEEAVEVCEVVGEKNVSAEKVAAKVVAIAEQYLQAKVPVGEYLADQLLLPMLLAEGGVFKSVKPSLHTLTNINLIEMMAKVVIRCEKVEVNAWEIEINKKTF